MSEVIQPLDLMGYSCKWSPHNEKLLAVASCKNFGFIGNSSIEVFALGGDEGTQLAPLAKHIVSDCVYDIAWCPARNSVVLYGNGSGGLHGWDVLGNVISFGCNHAHWQEVTSVDVSYTQPNDVLTASWDETLRVWDITRLPTAPAAAQGSSSSSPAGASTTTDSAFGDFSSVMSNITGDSICVSTMTAASPINSAKFHPTFDKMAVSAGQRGALALWDVNQGRKPALSWKGHDGKEVLSADFDKYRSFQLYTGGSDRCAYVWDIRNVKAPLARLSDHQLGVARVQASPFEPDVVLTSGFDMNVMLWDVSKIPPQSSTATSTPNSATFPPSTPALLGLFDRHSEFIFGVSWSFHVKHRVATASFDNTLRVWNTQQHMKSP